MSKPRQRAFLLLLVASVWVVVVAVIEPTWEWWAALSSAPLALTLVAMWQGWCARSVVAVIVGAATAAVSLAPLWYLVAQHVTCRRLENSEHPCFTSLLETRGLHTVVENMTSIAGAFLVVVSLLLVLRVRLSVFATGDSRKRGVRNASVAVVLTIAATSIATTRALDHTALDFDVLRATGPSLSHPFGTDHIGRDMLARTAAASYTSIALIGATLVVGGICMAAGLIARPYWPRMGRLLRIAMGTALALVVAGLACALCLPHVRDGPEGFDAWLLLAAATNPASGLGLTIAVAIALGIASRRLSVSNAMGVVLLLAVLVLGVEVGMSFMGLGLQPPDVSLGQLIGDAGRDSVQVRWWLLLFPLGAWLLIVGSAVALAWSLSDISISPALVAARNPRLWSIGGAAIAAALVGWLIQIAHPVLIAVSDAALLAGSYLSLGLGAAAAVVGTIAAIRTRRRACHIDVHAVAAALGGLLLALPVLPILALRLSRAL